jgi:hypothetical protein
MLSYWEQLATHAGWFLPYKKVCIIADRPVRQEVDTQRRLHCATGPAMLFADQFAIWSWHGVLVTQQIIEQPQRLTPEQIHSESNTEIQRVMIERYGWDRYLLDIKALLLDSDVDSSGRGTLRGLYVATLNGRPQHILACCCDSTGKTFHLEVPLEVVTCREAGAWLANESPDDFHLLVQS